jgi:hypothetical protein
MKTKIHFNKFVRLNMKHRPWRSTRTGAGLLLGCASIVLFAFGPTPFGQSRAEAQPSVHNPRLTPYHYAKVAAKQADIEATLNVMASDPNRTLPLWRFSVDSTRDGNTYTGVMVGASPFSRNADDTDVSVRAYVVPLVIVTHTVVTGIDFNTGEITTIPGDTTFDPTVADACLTAPNNVPIKLVAESPILQPAAFSFGGINVGHTQYVDAFQRANFWQALVDNRIKNKYHVTLNPAKFLAPIVIDVPADKGFAGTDPLVFGFPPICPPFGTVDLEWFDNYVTSTLIPALAAQGINPSNLPIFILRNVEFAFSPANNFFNWGIGGYHGATGSPIQTYISALFLTSGSSAAVSDTAILSHEVAEWMDDPFGNNPTPLWGHIPALFGCQTNLEVADPLTGTSYPPVVMPNGFTYHLQELAFFSWFYGAPSIGVNGWFSDNGTFLRDAGPPCH